MHRKGRFTLCALLAVLGACTPEARARRVVRVTLPGDAVFAIAALEAEPAAQLHGAQREGRTLVLDAGALAFTLRIPGMCPLSVPATTPAPLAAKALIDVPNALAQLGFAAQGELAVTPGCPEAAAGELVWRQVAGTPLAELSALDRGFRLRVRTAPRAAFVPDPLPFGVVPFSPRTQARAVLELVARIAGHPTLRRSVTVTALARATGLSSVAVAQRVMLGGEGWHVTRSPRGGHAQVAVRDGDQTFSPDVAGRFLLADRLGRSLEIQALSHDRTPMDCARSECHAQISRAALASPMSHAFSLPFAHAAAADATCALDCHVVGEPGLDDGGFRSLASALEVPIHAGLRFEALPRAVQRMAGVRCTSCHGPGAVPAHDGRARILRADVCATCHDAAPDYTHVAEWRAGAMARSDAQAAVRENPACARCHTTGGFLHTQGIRERADLSRDSDGALVGIACAACHAPHGEHIGAALLRATSLPPSLPVPELTGTPSGLCVQCHAPDLATAAPAASAAVLWLGRAKLPATFTPNTLRGVAPHAALEGGCLGCHGKAAAGSHGQRHTDHSFAVDLAICTSCHGEAMRSDAVTSGSVALAARAASLLSALSARCGSAPPASPPHAVASAACPSAELERARYGVRLVAEDPAAYAHNAPFARALLDDAERALAR